MKTKSKALLLTLCAVLLVAASVLGTMAYLTDTDSVKNTFTVGKVAITLDEAKVNTDGQPLDKNGKLLTPDDNGGYDLTKADRVKTNSYKLMPGHTYVKDPTIHVAAGSEDCYIVAKVTLTNASKWMAIMGENADLTAIFGGFNEANWYGLERVIDEKADTLTITFVYKNETKAESLKRVWQKGVDSADLLLFKEIVIPGTLTGAQLETVAGSTITVVAEAIQADGFVEDSNDAAKAAAAYTAAMAALDGAKA